MFWTIVPYLVPILLAVAIGGSLAYYAWTRQPSPGARPMVALALAIVIWSLFYALELSSPTLAAKVFWAKIQYLGIVSVPVAWFYLALEYTGGENWVTRHTVAFLSLIPLTTVLILWLEPDLVWSQNGFARGGAIAFFAPTHGPWFWVHSAYSYLLLLLGSVLMALAALRSPNLYRWQTGAFLLGILFPWTANACYVSGLTALDLTPFAFALVCLVVALAIFRVHLFDTMPVARATIVDSMNDPVLVLDGQNRIIDANPASRALLDRSPSSLVGRPLVSLHAPFSALVSDTEEGTQRHAELDVGTGEAQRFYEVRASTVRDRQDRIRGKVLLFHDITDRRRAEEALRREKAFSETIVNALPGVFYLLDQRGQLLRWNENLEAVTGYTSPELATIAPFDVLANGDRKKAREKWPTVFSKGKLTTEMAFVSNDGVETPYLFTGRRVTLGDTPHLVGMGLDIQERKQRERELECFVTVSRALRAANHREQMLPLILDEALRLLQGGGAMLVSRSEPTCRRVELANGGWQALTGTELLTDSFFCHEPSEPFFLADDVRDLPQWPQPALLEPFFAVVGARLMQDDQLLGIIWIGRRRPFAPAEGRALTAIAEIAANALSRAALLETVEQRVEERTCALNLANERLRGLDRVKTRLIDDVSHELRTPVTTLRLYLNLLERGKPSDRQRYLDVLHQQSNRLNKIIEGVLRFSRLEAMAAGESPQPIDLNEVVREVLVTLQPEAEAHQLQFQHHFYPSLPTVRGIHLLLAQALSQLVDNSLKYTLDGTVTVGTGFDQERQMALVQVQDTGMGISEEELPHVFERFYRGRRVSQLTTPGPGLGLALVQEIVTLHQGEVEIESEVDVGTTVRLSLPAISSAESPEALSISTIVADLPT